MGRGRNVYGRILGVLRHYTPNEAPRVHTEIRYEMSDPGTVGVENLHIGGIHRRLSLVPAGL